MNILMANLSDLLSNLDTYSETFLNNLGIWGAIFSSLLIITESILPFLPLCVFVTLVFYTFGNFFGFLISWICTVIGCILSFLLFRNKIKSWFENKLSKKKIGKKVKKIMKYIDKLSLSSLAILVAIPFTPAFAINIAAGLSNISKKKFLTGILIGKAFMVYFWGYIGTTLIECLTHPIYLVKILIMLVFAYIISKVINKYFELD